MRSGNFGWACASVTQGDVSAAGGPSPGDLVAAVAVQLGTGCPVALGFECPLFVPVPEAAARLGTARAGEGNRAWSAGAGSGAMATGLVQAAWILDAIHSRCSDATLHLDWESFADARSGLLLWEAFVTAKAKGQSHVDDARIAVSAFVASLPDPRTISTITAERPLSLAGAVALWSGWLHDPAALHTQSLVVRA